ncbi:MAG: hypothetical protein NTW37_15265 [Proteobacteria bacterium]|nr:hypothetical protein [Pseudomonadota bacterium]
MGETGPVISDEARTRGRLLFDAAINGTLGQVPLGPANDSSSAARAFPSTPGGAALYIERPRLAGDRVMTAPEYLFGVALPIFGAATGPVSFVAGSGAQMLVNRFGLSDTWTGLALETLASTVDPKRAVSRMDIGAASTGARYTELREVSSFLKAEAGVADAVRRRQIIASFGPDLRIGEYSGQVYQYSGFGGTASRYVTPSPLANPIQQLALPPSNPAVLVQQYSVTPTRVLMGSVAPQNFGAVLTGGAQQLFLPSRAVLTSTLHLPRQKQ